MLLNFATLIAILPFFVAAAPLPTPPRGARIPINKRSFLSNADGSVNLEALKLHLANAQEKLQRGVDTMARNEHSNHNLFIDSKSITPKPSSRIPLTDDAGQLWSGTISVGTPPVAYTVDFDTGSSDLFLSGPSCDASCDGHSIYNPAASTTSKDLGKTFYLRYGDGSSVTGEQWKDTVTIAGLSAQQQTLGAANKYSPGFAKDEYPPDGLMGMAFQSISIYDSSPVFQTLVTQGSTSPVFSFKLATSGSELYIGGSNPDLYTGSFTYTPVTNQGYWQVTLGSVNVGGKSVVNATTSIIDTGTTLIIGEAAGVAEFYKNIPGAQDASATIGPGFYTVSCDSIPSLNLSFTFGGRSFPISPSTFNLGRVSSDSSECVGGIATSPVASIGWVIGDVFLKNVYTTFDFGNAQVGFATLA